MARYRVKVGHPRPPVWAGVPSSLTLSAGQTHNFAQYASDPNNNPLTFSLISGPGSITSAGLYTAATSGAVVVRALDSTGLFTNSPSVSINSADTTAPTVPTITSVTQTAINALTISWSTSTDASSPITYTIERSPNQSTWAAISTTTATSYVDSGLTGATPYYYRVKATDPFGNTSNYSATASVGAVAPQFSVAPTSASISGSGGTIQFTAIDLNGPSLTYSLQARYRTDIEINPSTGLVTVPSSAAGTSGSITVRVTDPGGLYADAPCDVSVRSAQSGGWQLASGHYVPAKMAPQIIHPRPNTETNVWARCRRAPSGIEWSIPVAVQGGAWPFRYELVTGPSGMTIGETLPPDWLTNGLQNYGVLTWANPTIGNHSVSVRVTDQDGTQVTRDWVLEVLDRENTAYFIFVAPTGNNANSGSYSAPKQDIFGWYGTTYTQVTYPGRQVFYRGGTYTVDASLPVNYKWDHRATNKPCVFVGYPGETVTVRNGNGFPASMIDWSSGSGDICYQNITLAEPQAWADIGSGYTNYRKCHLRGGTAALARCLFFRNTFDGGGDTRADSGTNPSCIFFQGGVGSYHTITQNTFLNCDGMDTVLVYNNKDSLFEGNLIAGTYGGSWTRGWGYFMKGTSEATGVQRQTIRANRGDSVSKMRMLAYCSEFTGAFKGNIEVCWNNYACTESRTDAAGAGCWAIGQGGGSTGGTYGDFWSYRNNWRHPHASLFTFQSGSNNWQNDVIQHSGAYTDGFYIVNCTVQPTKVGLVTDTSGLLDPTTNLLTGAARTQYLGTHGCEVA